MVSFYAKEFKLVKEGSGRKCYKVELSEFHLKSNSGAYSNMTPTCQITCIYTVRCMSERSHSIQDCRRQNGNRKANRALFFSRSPLSVVKWQVKAFKCFSILGSSLLPASDIPTYHWWVRGCILSATLQPVDGCKKHHGSN